MTTAAPPSFALRLADVLDPPRWQPADRFTLEPHQTPPPQPWSLWILAGGRGAGKTEGAARYFASYMRANPGHRGRMIGPTTGDVIESCVLGPSGLQVIDPEIRFLPSAPGGAKVVWPNGSEAVLIGTSRIGDVERLRAAGNRHIDWWEEMAANPQLARAWDQAAFGLRLGYHPHSIASTTPRNTAAYRERVNDPGTVLTRGTIYDNPGQTKERVELLTTRYEGTRLGRQELMGELIEDIEGALWSHDLIDATRIVPELLPDLQRIVVAVDPAVTSGENADDTGIVIAGRVADRGYILGDWTCHLSPDGWARKAVQALDAFQADRIVGEVNNGGDLVELTIRTVRQDVPYRAVRATRGKALRAEPIAALYEQGRIYHVGAFPELEDQMCSWTPEDDKSPDRLDALVWALTELGFNKDRQVAVTSSRPSSSPPVVQRGDLRLVGEKYVDRE